ncbi:MAG: hypothetical protein FWC15_08355, partial [Fibromonadales bacterium]|nr:hypothetical protein [Fibromonadales bacterium]
MFKLFVILIFLAGCAAQKKETATGSSAADALAASQIPGSYKDIVFPEFQYIAPYPGDYRIPITDSITLYAVRDTTIPLVDLTFYFKENAFPKSREEVAALQLLSSL